MLPVTSNASATVLALHHGYRIAGGEERAAAQLADLAEAQLGERVAWLRRDSTQLGARDAARGLLTGGTAPGQVEAALAHCGADLVHAHNLFPTFGPAALSAARAAGAAVAVHLHNYRLVCAVATTVRRGRDCTECHAGRPLPGIRHRCRGGLPEALAYGAALPAWQAKVIDLADVVIVPSLAARARLEQLGLQLPADRVHVVGGVAGAITPASRASRGRFALTVTRLAPEKDLRTAIDACAAAGIPLVIAGDGPERDALLAYVDQGQFGARAGSAHRPSASAAQPSRPEDSLDGLLGDELVALLAEPPVIRGNTIFVGRVDDRALAALRAQARIGLATSVAHETFGLSALESMVAALPTVGSAVGALPELLGAGHVVPPGEPVALAQLIRAMAGDDAAGDAAAARAASVAGPATIGARLGQAYAAARAHAAARRAAD